MMIYLIPFLTPCLAVATCADARPGSLGMVLCQVKDQALVGVLILIYAASVLIGLGLLVTGIFKLKQVKDNPTQIPVSTPAAFFVSGALLLFMPSLFPVIRNTVFGSGSDVPASVTDATGTSSTTTITNLLG